MSSTRAAPEWKSSAKEESLEDQLYLYNSFTKKKVNRNNSFFSLYLFI